MIYRFTERPKGADSQKLHLRAKPKGAPASSWVRKPRAPGLHPPDSGALTIRKPPWLEGHCSLSPCPRQLVPARYLALRGYTTYNSYDWTQPPLLMMPVKAPASTTPMPVGTAGAKHLPHFHLPNFIRLGNP